MVMKHTSHETYRTLYIYDDDARNANVQHILVTRVSLHDGLNDGNLQCVYESCVSVYEADSCVSAPRRG